MMLAVSVKKFLTVLTEDKTYPSVDFTELWNDDDNNKRQHFPLEF
jgi:hypothetical protein